jgi:hypothetical protein
MSDLMLHGVLNMPPELWHGDPLDKMQRYGRYMEASRRIEDLSKALLSLTAASDWAMHVSDEDEILIGKLIALAES